ncbi:MAG: hypothetical protein DRO99_05095, partial [Candidatus Aenigmatarchaeota archaeon]
DGNHYFIEANSAPGVHGRVSILGKIADYMKKQGGVPCVMTSLKFRGHPDYPKLWVPNTMKKFLPGMRLCYEEHNKGRRKTLLDSDGNEFKPGSIFKNEGHVPRYFEGRVPIINSRKVTVITKDKLRTYDAVLGHIPEVPVPKTFSVRSERGARKRMEKNPGAFRDGFVLKPVDGALGRGVRVYDSPDDSFGITHEMILQQRIIPRLRGGRYWDLRIHLLDGKFIGGIVRSSRKNVTNTARGGTAGPAPKDLTDRVRGISEKIVDAIEKESRKIRL